MSASKVDFQQVKNKTLGGLDDVNATSPADGQVLTYKSSTGKWSPVTPSGGGGGGGDSVSLPASDITLSKTDQEYIEVNGTGRNIKLPASDPYTTARTPSSHTHGNITNAGAINMTNRSVPIENDDRLVIADASNSGKVAATTLAFDGSTTTEFLSRKGTWETPSGGGGGGGSTVNNYYGGAYAEENRFENGNARFVTANGDFQERGGAMAALRFASSLTGGGPYNIIIDGGTRYPIFYQGELLRDGLIVAGDVALVILSQGLVGIDGYHLLTIDRWQRGAPLSVAGNGAVSVNTGYYLTVDAFSDGHADKLDFLYDLSNCTNCGVSEIQCLRGDTFTITLDNTQGQSACTVELYGVIHCGRGGIKEYSDPQNPVDVEDVLVRDNPGLLDANTLTLDVENGAAVTLRVCVMEPDHVQDLVPNSANLYAMVEVLAPMRRY